MIVDYLHQFLFGLYPYICLTVFVVASVVRYDRDQYTWKADSSQLLRKNGMRLGSNLFHIGIIFLFFGHLVGLLTPHAVYESVMTAGQKVMLAMIAGSIAGLICLVGMLILLQRRLFDPRIRATSKFSDSMILIVLCIQLVLGLVSVFYSMDHPDGSSMVVLAEWSQRIVTFRSGAADLIAGQAWIFQWHLVLGMTIFLLFPFTRMVHVLSGISAPIKYLFRSGYQIVRKRG